MNSIDSKSKSYTLDIKLLNDKLIYHAFKIYDNENNIEKIMELLDLDLGHKILYLYIQNEKTNILDKINHFSLYF